MAVSSPKLELDDVLEKLGLKKFYPEKLSREELYQITPESLNTEQREKSPLAWQFIYNLTRYNYHARNVKTSGTELVETFKMSFRERTRLKRDTASAHIHPLDVLVAIFLCCDTTAKQDFVMHLWGCKLAMPFSIQFSGLAKPSVFLWPFRSLIGQFQHLDSYAEMQMIHKPMKCIALIRVGENEQYSKSNLLNCLIGGSEKPHPIFFHRNSEGSKRFRSSASAGLVELGWFLPSETNTGRFREPKLFVNLRGDSLAMKNQIDLVGRMATVTIVLCTLQNLYSTKMLVAKLLGLKSRVILLISDQNPDEDEISNYIQNSFENQPESHFDVVTAERFMLSEILDMLIHSINRMEKGGKEIVLSNIVKSISSLTYNVDEAHTDFAVAFEYSKDIINAIRSVDAENRKLILLPLQEKFWKSWAQLDRDFWRFDQLDESDKKKCISKDKLEKEMTKMRKQQFDQFARGGISIPMKIFIKALSSSNKFVRKIFLRMLKLELDNLSRIHLKPFYDEYQELVNLTITAREEERISINSQLTELDEMKSKLSFGMEHVIRELGQIYEACESQSYENIIIPIDGQNIPYQDLPRYACLSLLEGYPVEILDGEACSVPTLWLRAIFKQLPNVLKDDEITTKPADEILVHAISVLGIQSSGKSTFLNVMFGLQFAVSAGRCTRGAFMQLVKVQRSMKNDIEADFILMIDTEGLKAAELTSIESVKHDNELSTFVIGLADTTIINLMGENATYLQENLPIAVHAFLRMNLVGLNPRCTIVHHNVDKRNKEKLLQQSRILESVLNNLTKKACEIEKIPPRQFHEIIEFSIANHTDYVPSLFEGEQPMASINIGYSKEADYVRTKLINFVRSDSKIENIGYFIRHLESLWNAIKNDRFVYEFRTTLETEARLNLDKGYSRILLQFFKQVDKIVNRLINRLKSKEYTCEEVEVRFSKDISVIEKKSKAELEAFIDSPKKIRSSCFDQWKQKCSENFQVEMKKSRDSSYETFRNINAQICPAISMDKFETFRSKMYQLRNEDFESRFPKVWGQFVRTLNFPQPSILADITEALQGVCMAHKHLLAEKNVKTFSLSQFRLEEMKHLNHSFHRFPQTRITELLSKMHAIEVDIKKEYSKELSEVLNNHLPYSYIIPKQILLKIEQTLCTELDNFDKNNEISQSFSIDLLLYTSGSLFNDLWHYEKETSFLGYLEKEMRNFMQNDEDETKKNSDILLEMVFEIIDKDIKSNFIKISHKYLHQCLLESYWGKIVYSKQRLLGMCLFQAINQNLDQYLSLYFHSPDKAAFELLRYSLEGIAKSNVFKKDLQTYVQESTSEVYNAICGCFTKRDISFDELFKNMRMNIRIDLNTISFFQFKNKKRMSTTVNLDIFNCKMIENFDKLVTTKADNLVKDVICDSVNVLSTLAYKISDTVIGCKELCPFCNEICKFSSCHPGQHECFIHRPVGCRGLHWTGTAELSYETCTLHRRKGNFFECKGRYISFEDFNTVYRDWKIDVVINDEEVSCVWKWIFVNKYEILQPHGSYKLPKNMPDHWYSINKKNVLRNIEQQFEL